MTFDFKVKRIEFLSSLVKEAAQRLNCANSENERLRDANASLAKRLHAAQVEVAELKMASGAKPFRKTIEEIAAQRSLRLYCPE